MARSITSVSSARSSRGSSGNTTGSFCAGTRASGSNLALSYGGRTELADAARALVLDAMREAGVLQ